MLLYAKIDEDIVPDADFVIGSNAFSVKTLDLSQVFVIANEAVAELAMPPGSRRKGGQIPMILAT